MKIQNFSDNQFTPTQWETAASKARFANQFIEFVESGFSESKFPNWFYKRLSNCFGMIAHYDREGFYCAQFPNLSKKKAFIWNCLDYPCFGDPSFTYSDVEKLLQDWIVENKVSKQLEKKEEEQMEINERAELNRLKEKYEKYAS